MKRVKLSTNFAVFLLFFGIAMLEAFRTRNWLMAGFWVMVSILFLAADNPRKTK